MKKSLALINAIERSWKYPGTFHLPPDEKVKGIKKGSIVKICLEDKETNEGVRPWIKVTETDGYRLKGRIDIKKSNVNGIKKGKRIEFTIEHVLDVYDDDCIARAFSNGNMTLEQAVKLMKRFYPDRLDGELKHALMAFNDDVMTQERGKTSSNR
jgi:hypothetical protein